VLVAIGWPTPPREQALEGQRGGEATNGAGVRAEDVSDASGVEDGIDVGTTNSHY